MIIYYDGSETAISGSHNSITSFGIHVNHQGEILEHADAFEIRAPGCHELIALIEAVKFIQPYQITADQASFYTDDELTVGANHQWNAGTGQNRSSFYTFKRRIETILKHRYSEDIINQVYHYVEHARFVKVRSHSGVVNNHRVDYLAKRIRNKITGKDDTIRNYRKWAFDFHVLYGNSYKVPSPLPLPFTQKEKIFNEYIDSLNGQKTETLNSVDDCIIEV
jgi:ribonuclease HI